MALLVVLGRRYDISLAGKDALTSAAKFLGPTGQPPLLRQTCCCSLSWSVSVSVTLCEQSPVNNIARGGSMCYCRNLCLQVHCNQLVGCLHLGSPTACVDHCTVSICISVLSVWPIFGQAVYCCGPRSGLRSNFPWPVQSEPLTALLVRTD